MSSRVYAFADVGRTGLGNMLFPWARAEVFRHRHGVPMLAPQWTQFKIGPLLRSEKDLRFYTGMFSNHGYIRGVHRWWVLTTARRIEQADAEAFAGSRAVGDGGRRITVVRFSGWEGWFNGLLHDKALVSRRLFDIMRPALKERLARQPVDYVIAAHVRRGDKPPMTLGETIPDRWSHGKGMPDQWFVNCIKNVRAALGTAAPVKIFSDAKPAQLAAILTLENVTLAEDNVSIVDTFRLSKARVLITTSTSSFSAWASYLGGMPTLWYPGLAWDLNLDKPWHEIETDLQGGLPTGAEGVIRAAVG